MLIIPVQAVPSQTLTVSLNNQTTELAIYTHASGLYMDVSVNNTLIVGGRICQNLNRIVRAIYLGFSGDIAFGDTQGTDDPVYTGLGTRFLLGYFFPSELPSGQG